jgi:hypothetical protein
MEDVLRLVPAETLAQIALAIVVGYAIYRVGWVPRKGPHGERLSSILMPGWQHDKEMEACEKREAATRRFYENQMTELRKQTDVRVGEVRGYRDEAMASNATLLASLDSATKDISSMMRLLEELAARDKTTT